MLPNISDTIPHNERKRLTEDKANARPELRERRRFARFRRDDLRIYLSLDPEAKGRWAPRSRLMDISQNGLAIFQRHGQELKQARLSIKVQFGDSREFVLRGAVRRIRSKKVGIFNGCEYGIELEAPGPAFRDHLLNSMAGFAEALVV